MTRRKEIQLTWDQDHGRFIRKGKQTRATERFLRGPIPYDWLTHAARLPGSALSVGVCLWHLAGLRSTRQDLALSTERLESLSVSRHSKDRALIALAAAGLITVERKRGRSPRVSLVTGTRKRASPSR